MESFATRQLQLLRAAVDLNLQVWQDVLAKSCLAAELWQAMRPNDMGSAAKDCPQMLTVGQECE